MVAGEASGDALGADLLQALRERGIPFEARGMGGPAMSREGLHILHDPQTLSVVGLTEAIRVLPAALTAFHRICQEAKRWQPSLAILIDLPDFNLLLARRLKRWGIKIIFYAPPQVWAWRTYRLKTIKRLADHVLSILPFEASFFLQAGVPTTFVGHPAVDRATALPPAQSLSAPSLPASARRFVPDSLSTASHPFAPSSPALSPPALSPPALSPPTLSSPSPSLQEHGRPSSIPQLLLLPGSRRAEVKRHLPAMLACAALLKTRLHALRIVIAAPEWLPDSLYQKQIDAHTSPIELTRAPVPQVASTAAACLVASGTATLEVCLQRTPMIIIYRVSSLTHWIGRHLLRRLPFIGLPNLVAQREVAPERIQHFEPDEWATHLHQYITSPSHRERMRRDLESVRTLLGPAGAADRAARVICQFL